MLTRRSGLDWFVRIDCIDVARGKDALRQIVLLVPPPLEECFDTPPPRRAEPEFRERVMCSKLRAAVCLYFCKFFYRCRGLVSQPSPLVCFLGSCIVECA